MDTLLLSCCSHSHVIVRALFRIPVTSRIYSSRAIKFFSSDSVWILVTNKSFRPGFTKRQASSWLEMNIHLEMYISSPLISWFIVLDLFCLIKNPMTFHKCLSKKFHCLVAVYKKPFIYFRFCTHLWVFSVTFDAVCFLSGLLIVTIGFHVCCAARAFAGHPLFCPVRHMEYGSVPGRNGYWTLPHPAAWC